jgi:hypothetical protein
MAVTYRRRKPAVPYRTRLTGRLMLLTKAFSKKARLTENEGFGVTRRTPRHIEMRVAALLAIKVKAVIASQRVARMRAR